MICYLLYHLGGPTSTTLYPLAITHFLSLSRISCPVSPRNPASPSISLSHHGGRALHEHQQRLHGHGLRLLAAELHQVLVLVRKALG